MGENTAGVVVVGCGYWGKNLIRVFAELGALHGICDAGDEALAAQKQLYPAAHTYRSVEDVARDKSVSAVALATPAPMHASQILQLVEAGKDVFVEKPLALTARDARLAIAAASKQRRVLMAGHLLEYHPAFVALREATHEGSLGKLRYMVSNRLSLGKIRSCEDVWWSFAPHDISMLCALAQAAPATVRLQGHAWLQDNIVDAATAHLTWECGLVGQINVGWAHPYKEHKLVAVGTAATAVFDDTLPENKVLLTSADITLDGAANPIVRHPATPLPYPAKEPLAQECAHFLRACHTREAPRTGGEAALRVVAVLEAGAQSLLQNGEPVQVFQYLEENQ